MARSRSSKTPMIGSCTSLCQPFTKSLRCSTHRFRPTKYPKMQRNTKTSNRNSIMRRRLSLGQIEFTFSFTSQSLCQSFRFVSVSSIVLRNEPSSENKITAPISFVDLLWCLYTGKLFLRCFTFGFLSASAEFDGARKVFLRFEVPSAGRAIINVTCPLCNHLASNSA